MDTRVAFISVLRGGDEHILSYWHCPACESYMVEQYHDRFMGGSSVRERGPLPASAVAAELKAIAACPSPNDKHCRCAAHDLLGG